MTRLIQITVLLGLVLTTSTAQAAMNNRAECYAVVIAHCNTKSHPEACLNSALPQCDAQFPKVEIPPTRKTPSFKAN